ncbi:hypothetical protein HID58_005051 [Brassica napus]|uniref:Transposase-associated domain-containing protein n=1 Tax=Brassica napus TaxID=3708 RepID=A0ABQ8E7I0_BRANA|nr:hypothetical protein HID58_005051 [Brassica napus]
MSEWMDQRIDPESNSVSEVFLGGINAFLQFACNQADYIERQTLLCPCARCKNVKQRDAKVVSRHLFLYGFKGNYYVWTSHGEKFYTVGESSGANHSTGEEEMWENPTWNAHENHYQSNPEVPAEPIEETEGESVVNAQLVDNTVLQTFMMLNCETFAPYERMFEEYMTLSVPDITPAAMQKAKDTKFAEWCKDYVSNCDQACFIPYPRVRRQSVDDWWACAKIFPRGIRETSEIALTAWQDDRRDQVAESSLLRVETHVVDDVSDYDITPVNPPDDEYVSDGDMASRRGQGTSPPMPPGATGVAATGQASSSRSNSYPQMSLNAMFNAPARISQPHLHPDKINGALWFSIDPSVNAFIRATWQAYYMGPWKSWRSVPDERRDSWWQTKISTGSNSLMTWSMLSGRRKHGLRLTVETGEPPSYTDLVRRTHTKKDGTFVDYRAEELVTQAEMEATQVSNTNSDGSPQSPSATSAPSRILLNQAYLKNAKGKRGHIYGLGSAQYREHAPSARVPASLARNLELELRVSGLETSFQSVIDDVSAVKADVGAVKEDVATMKEDFAATRAAIAELIQSLRPQANPQQQPPSTQSQDPSTQA